MRTTIGLKQDIFTIKAVESKGYDIQELIKLSDKELDELPLSVKLIEFVKNYKQRGGKTAQEIADEIADIMSQGEVTIEDDSVLNDYKTDTEEQIAVKEEIEEQVVIPEDEVKIVIPEVSQEDIDIIKAALQKKELRGHVSYMKFLKTEVPQVILDAVNGSVLNDLINARLTEIKSSK